MFHAWLATFLELLLLLTVRLSLLEQEQLTVR